MESTAEVQTAANCSAAWAKRFQANEGGLGRHLLLCGQSGTGKTHISSRLHSWAKRMSIPAWESGNWAHPPRIYWAEWAEVMFLDVSDFRDWIGRLDDCDLMFLEDVGAEVDRFKSGEPTERFREVMNVFKHRWLFITTNVMPEHWAIRWDDRVADRLLRESTIVSLRTTPRFTNL